MDEATRRSFFAHRLVMFTEVAFWAAFELQHLDGQRRLSGDRTFWSPEMLDALVADWRRIVEARGVPGQQVAAAALSALPIEQMYGSSQRAAAFVNFLVYLLLTCGGQVPMRPGLGAGFAGILQRLGRQTFDVRAAVAACLAASSGVFLQVGANDAAGADDRNYRAILAAPGWRKVLVEPVPAAVAALRRNTGELPDVTVIDAAVSESAGSRTMTVFPDSRLSTLDPRLAATARAGARGRQLRIRCVDGAALFAEAGIDRIDVLVSDTEGHDRVVIEQILARTTPGAIILEFGHLSSGDQAAVIDLLEARGYAWCWAPLSLDLFAAQLQP